MSIPISTVKEIRERLDMTHLILFAVDSSGKQHVATHGKTKVNAQQAAKAGNKLKSALGWPDELCASAPLERSCANCIYFKPDYGMWCFNGWSGDGSVGHCLVEPSAIRVAKDYGCRYFEPKY